MAIAATARTAPIAGLPSLVEPSALGIAAVYAARTLPDASRPPPVFEPGVLIVRWPTVAAEPALWRAVAAAAAWFRRAAPRPLRADARSGQPAGQALSRRVLADHEPMPLGAAGRLADRVIGTYQRLRRGGVDEETAWDLAAADQLRAFDAEPGTTWTLPRGRQEAFVHDTLCAYRARRLGQGLPAAAAREAAVIASAADDQLRDAAPELAHLVEEPGLRHAQWRADLHADENDTLLGERVADGYDAENPWLRFQEGDLPDPTWTSHAEGAVRQRAEAARRRAELRQPPARTARGLPARRRSPREEERGDHAR